MSSPSEMPRALHWIARKCIDTFCYRKCVCNQRYFFFRIIDFGLYCRSLSIYCISLVDGTMHTTKCDCFIVTIRMVKHVRFDPTQNFNFKMKKKRNLQSELDKLTRHD